MPALLVHAFACDVRSADALIASGELGFLCKLFQFVGDDCASRQKHWQAWTDVIVENEQLEFLAEFAVVALLRFLEHREVVVEFLFRFERRAVNALELGILFVALVVSARHARELERADVSRAHDVRAGTQIDKVAAAIERNSLVRRNVFDDVDLVFAWFRSIA